MWCGTEGDRNFKPFDREGTMIQILTYIFFFVTFYWYPGGKDFSTCVINLTDTYDNEDNMIDIVFAYYWYCTYFYSSCLLF